MRPGRPIRRALTSTDRTTSNRARLETKRPPDGWLNRLEGRLPATERERAAPTRAISVGALLPRIFKGQNRVTTIASGATAARPTVLDQPSVSKAFKAIYSGDPAMGPMLANYIAARGDVVAAIKNADPEMMAANNGAPSSYAFASDAARLGTLMQRDPRVQLGFLAVSGWDTHANQGASAASLLACCLPSQTAWRRSRAVLDPHIQRR